MRKQRVVLRDVAREAKVSVSAVSLVIHNKPGVGPEKRERVRKALARLGYGPTAASGNGKSQIVGLLIEKSSVQVISDMFYGDILRGFQTEAQRLGCQVMLHMFDRAAESIGNLSADLSSAVNGLVIANDGDITSAMVLQLEALNLPLVLIENYVPGHQLPCIIGDNFTAGYTVMRHLIGLGHRSLAVLCGPQKYSSLTDRLKGCLAAAAEEGILINPDYMPHPVSGRPQKGYLQMQEVLRLPQLPTAVVAVSDKTAFGAIEAIKEAGLRIPEEIAIAAIDNVVESAYTRPTLTSFNIPRFEMGVLAMQKLHRQINGDSETPVKSIVYGELIVRESCGALQRISAPDRV